MTDDYGATKLMRRFARLKHASRVLRLERSRNDKGWINIERLMTRIEGSFPFEASEESEAELRLLLVGLRQAFADRLEEAKHATRHDAELNAVARHCVLSGVDCITFNYDDVFDEALWKVRSAESILDESYWHPDGGYGFFCRPSSSTVVDTRVFMDRSSMLLLKLHGSMNWRPRRGSTRPYAVNAIVHEESWLPRRTSAGFPADEDDDPLVADDVIALHLEPEPFFVPPVLVKDDLFRQPVLRLVWSQAYDILRRAKTITFIGYSMPLTDLATTFLLAEALADLPSDSIRVVTRQSPETKGLIRRYQQVLPDLDRKQIDTRGALEWARGLTSARAASEQLKLGSTG